MGYARVIHERKKSIEKNGQVSEISKTMGTQMPTIKRERKKKREMNKIAHVFLQSIFKFQTRETCFNEHSGIRLATIYIPRTYTS